jgi:hypothetical protein
MKDLTIRGAIEIGQKKVSILLSEVKSSDPDLNISGEYTLDRASGSTKMSMEGKSIDVHSTRRSALSLAGDIPVIRNIFDIVQAGTIPVLHFSSSGKLSVISQHWKTRGYQGTCKKETSIFQKRI